MRVTITGELRLLECNELCPLLKSINHILNYVKNQFLTYQTDIIGSCYVRCQLLWQNPTTRTSRRKAIQVH